jgi:uncharacterized protein (UPF0276 family)
VEAVRVPAAVPAEVVAQAAVVVEAGAVAVAAAEGAEEVSMIGLGYRHELAEWIASRPKGVDCLEVTAEHFYHGSTKPLEDLRRHFHLFVHGLGLSLGTPGPLDQERLKDFARVVSAAQPDWISEHVAFTRTAEVDLGHLNPLRPTRETAKIVADHAREIAQCCGKPLLLENITSHVRVAGELSETGFLNEICSQANCGLLLDVTNLYINSRNHGFEPLAWLHELDRSRIRQLHIVGYSEEHGCLVDNHAQPIQSELLDLARAVLDYAPVEAVILEHDADFPGPAIMDSELDKLRRLFGRN